MNFRSTHPLTKSNPCRPVLALALFAVGGCTAPYYAPVMPGGQNQQTAALENNDRIARFQRLSGLVGVAPPQIEQRVANPGQAPGLTQPVPVVRVVFDEGSVFDSGSDRLRPEAAPMLDIVADSMRRDVPDAQLTLLGHTDATGSDAANNELSQRRARAVFQALVNRGVNAGQLSTVAIGRNQPIAGNDTAAGRARNRRVEFLISADLEANLAVVGERPIQAAYFARTPGVRPSLQSAARASVVHVSVLRTAVYKGPADVSEAAPQGSVRLQAVGSIDLDDNGPGKVNVSPNKGS